MHQNGQTAPFTVVHLPPRLSGEAHLRNVWPEVQADRDAGLPRAKIARKHHVTVKQLGNTVTDFNAGRFTFDNPTLRAPGYWASSTSSDADQASEDEAELEDDGEADNGNDDWAGVEADTEGLIRKAVPASSQSAAVSRALVQLAVFARMDVPDETLLPPIINALTPDEALELSRVDRWNDTLTGLMLRRSFKG